MTTQDKNELVDNGTKVRTFLHACCCLVKHKLPPVAQHALQLAKEYDNGLVTQQQLADERVKLWKHMDDEKPKLNVSQQNELDSAIRAAICCLVVEQDEHEMGDSIEWGMCFCNRLEQHQQEQLQIRNRIFGF